MLARRSLMLFHLGMVLVCLATGGISTYALSLTQPAHLQSAERLIDQRNAQAINEDEDIEHIRLKALYYLDLARNLQKRKYEEADLKYDDVRLVSFFGAAAFLIGTILIFSWRPVSTPYPH